MSKPSLSLIIAGLLAVGGCSALQGANPFKQEPPAANRQPPVVEPAVPVKTGQESDVRVTTESAPEPVSASLDVHTDAQRASAEAEAQSLLEEARAAELQEAVSELPDYATSTRSVPTLTNNCDFKTNADQQAAALELARKIATSLKIEPGEIYVSPTLIPDRYSDCAQDVAQSVRLGLAANSAFTPVGPEYQGVSAPSARQASSSAAIPLLVRSCRAARLPYLCISSVARIGDDLRLTVRIIRVVNGVTLHQNYVKL